MFWVFQRLHIFRACEATQAADQAFESFYVKLVPPPERVDDLGPGIAFFRVTSVVGQLNILNL